MLCLSYHLELICFIVNTNSLKGKGEFTVDICKHFES